MADLSIARVTNLPEAADVVPGRIYLVRLSGGTHAQYVGMADGSLSRLDGKIGDGVPTAHHDHTYGGGS